VATGRLGPVRWSSIRHQGARVQPQHEELERSPAELAGAVLQEPGALESPQALLAIVRDAAPVIEGPHSTFLVTGYDEAKAVYIDHKRFSSASARDQETSLYEEHARTEREAQVAKTFMDNNLILCDEPVHGRLRSAVRDAFSVRSVKGWRPKIDHIVAELVGSVQGLDRFDAVRMLGYPLPEQVICEIVGAPYDDFERMERWSRVVSSFPRTRPPTGPEVRQLVDASAGFFDYFDALFEHRDGEIGDDLISRLIEANADANISREELIAQIVLVIIAGHDTTANMVTNGLYHLLQHPAEYARLRDDPELVPSAVEEMMRFEPSAPFPPPRRSVEEVEIGGTVIPAQCPVLPANHAAGRDPKHYDDPDRFDVGRFVDQSTTPHLSFGWGIHRCLGEHLARAELQSMFLAIVTQLPELEIIEKGAWHPGFFRHIESLVVGPKEA
jgi:cytochrome P450